MCFEQILTKKIGSERYGGRMHIEVRKGPFGCQVS